MFNDCDWWSSNDANKFIFPMHMSMSQIRVEYHLTAFAFKCMYFEVTQSTFLLIYEYVKACSYFILLTSHGIVIGFAVIIMS